MSHGVEHPSAEPCWIDLSTPDLAESAAFYGGLFGWETAETPAEAYGYTMFTLAGKHVAGAAPVMGDERPGWSVYVATDDADATSTAVTQAGGTVVVPPMDVLDAGRMACFIDPNGAAFKAWQPQTHRGAEAVHAPNTWTWSELLSRDLPASTAFYGSVFGWGVRSEPAYSEWQHDGHSIGGLMQMPPMVPEQIPSFWTAYIAVEDVDAALARATELGGAVRVPNQDFAGGRFGVLEDVHQCGLGVLRLHHPG